MHGNRGHAHLQRAACVKQPGWGVLAGALGAAATGVAVGVAAKQRAKIAADRRRLATQLSETSEAPRGEPCSVVADDGVRLSCEEIEAAEQAALTVVLVHGFALDRRTWHFQRPFLAALTDPRVRVVLYDQRSHGRSERAPRESCTIEQLGHDLDAVIRALAPEGPLVLVGHSMGGMTIMALADHYPELVKERVAGVAFLATSAGEVGSSGLSGTWLSRRNPLTRGVGLLAALQPSLVEGVRKAASDVVWAVTRRLAYGDRDISPALVDLADSMISANAVDALTDFVDTIGSHDRLAALPALATCEVLVAAGDGDRVIPFSHSEVIAAELPEARLVRFDGVGHLPMLERADAMNEALADLLRRCAARGRGSLRDSGRGHEQFANHEPRPLDIEIELPTAADTEALGERLADGLGAGDLVVLTGPLGAGKTVLVRGLARGPRRHRGRHVADVRDRPRAPGGARRRGAARARRRLPPRRPGRAGRPRPRHRPRPGRGRRGVGRGGGRAARREARARPARPPSRRRPHRRRLALPDRRVNS